MKTIKLYRKRSDGSISLLELNPDSYSDRDSFNEAVDFYYAEGYYQTYTEAATS